MAVWQPLRLVPGNENVDDVALVDPDVEAHRAEITRQNKTTPAIVVVVLVCAVAAVLYASSSGDDTPAPTTTSTSATTMGAVVGSGVGRTPVVGVATAGGRLFVFGSRKPGVMGATAAPDLELHFGSPAIAVGSLVAVLGSDGSVLAGHEGAPFQPVACCFDDLVASDIGGAVWAIDGTSRAVLVDLDSGPTGDELDLDGARIIGPAPKGLATVDSSDQATWRQTDRDPVPIEVPRGRTAVSSGGGVVAVVVSGTGTVELRRIDDGRVVRTYDAPETPTGVVVSTNGDAVAITRGRSTIVFPSDGGRSIGRIDGADSIPVSVGDRHFAAIVAGEVVDSEVGKLPLAARPIVLATRIG